MSEGKPVERRGRPKLNLETHHVTLSKGTGKKLLKEYPHLTISQVMRFIVAKHLADAEKVENPLLSIGPDLDRAVATAEASAEAVL